MDEYLKRQEEKRKKERESRKKSVGLKSFLSNFNSVAEGKYEWNGSEWVTVN